ncbi:ATP-binding protein [Fervidobacterium nodosum]|uniref:ATPase n=1 Tax=Fervidobacterium nodosum (strain ATCC 35602 / DSM 5306 / Rt17-B1) TaxID=381764 RepID=A7HKK3_FERNB|nr:ATP-binding protein [Fervidobacterium nodosum]ABS60436.1 ATPase [Fervidobacterium nodosum Rt17-B1]PHJ14578.1 ATPase [Fervidobacterium sp. SC_NGM5_G05]
MDEKKLKYIIEALFDKPIDNGDLLVDREKEIEHLNKIAYFQPMGIFGVCGETGVGKTTTLNFINSENAKRFYVLITEKDSKEVIIGDFLYKLSNLALGLKKKEINKVANEAKEFILTEMSQSTSYGAGLSVSASFSYGKSTVSKKRFNIYTVKDYLDELLSLLVKVYGKILVIIDELDKEKKEEVLNILDSLKSVLFKENIVTFVSLPFSIYREYSNDRMRWNESGNLENIFRDMIFLDPLTVDDIKKMILKRIKEYPDYFEMDALDEIAAFSDGNPRDALWIAQQIAIINSDKDKISKEVVKESIREIMAKGLEKTWSFTEIQKTILQELINNPLDKSELVKRLEKKIKRQTVYTYVKRMIDDGVLTENNGVLRVSTKIKYYIESL